jgi:hypothetical protein
VGGGDGARGVEGERWWRGEGEVVREEVWGSREMAGEDADSCPDLTPPSSGPLPEAVPVPGPLAVVRTAEEIQRCYEEELGAARRVKVGLDLVFAAKRQLGFLRTIDSLPCLHKGPAVLRAIRRFSSSLSLSQNQTPS